MKYFIKEKFFSIKDVFYIKDQYEQDIFKVLSKIISFGNHLRMYDNKNNEVCEIKQSVFRFLPEYNIIMGDTVVANLKSKLSVFTKKLSVSSSFVDYTIDGNVLAHDFTIYKNRRVVCTVSKTFFSLRDYYCVDINEDENPAFILSMVICIDQIYHDKRG